MSDVLTVLPPNASVLEKATDRALATRLDAIPVPIRTAWDADIIPLDTLPWLAWGVGRKTWNTAWPEEVRRSIVRDAYPIARRTGTVRAVRDAIAVVESALDYGGELEIVEWWQTTPRGTPRTFRVEISLDPETGAPPPAAFVEELIDEISAAKPLTAHFALSQSLSVAGGYQTVGAIRPTTVCRLEFAQRPPLHLSVVTDDGSPVVDGSGASVFLEL